MNKYSDKRANRDLATRIGHWLLITGDRLLVALLMLVIVGVAFLVAGYTGIASVTMSGRVMWYLNGTVNGLLTLIPITVGVNQIVLSHEFGSIQDLYDRRTDITEFRERVEERTQTEAVSPHASDFFRTLLQAISEVSEDVREHPQLEGQVSSDIDSLSKSLADESNRVKDDLSASGTSMIRTLIIMLSYDDSWKYHEVRRLQTKLPDDADVEDELERINELLVEIDAARQFLKTVVVERQLARLSRQLVYTGIPAVTIATIGIFSYRDIAGWTMPRPLLVCLAGVIVIATLVPLAILSAYVLRVATIALQTAAYGPFIPESTD